MDDVERYARTFCRVDDIHPAFWRGYRLKAEQVSAIVRPTVNRIDLLASAKTDEAFERISNRQKEGVECR